MRFVKPIYKLLASLINTLQMRKFIGTLTIILFTYTTYARNFTIEVIQKRCSTNYNDYDNRFVCLKQNDSVIIKVVKTRGGKFSIKNLKQGNYTLEYKNVFGQICSKKITLEKRKSNVIEICVDDFLDFKKSTYFDEIEKDTLNLEYHSSSCFHSVEKEVNFYNKNEDYFIQLKNKEGEMKIKKLSDDEKKQVSLFFRKLSIIQFSSGGCTTVDSYIIKRKNKDDFYIIDSSCDWKGFSELEKIIE